MSQTTVNYLSVHYQHPFYRLHRLQSDDGRSTVNSHEYCTLQLTTFGLKIYRGDVKKWSRGNIEPDYRELPLGTQPMLADPGVSTCMTVDTCRKLTDPGWLIPRARVIGLYGLYGLYT